MNVRSIKTNKVVPGSIGLQDLLGSFLPRVKERTIVAVTSKVVAICEGRIEWIGNTDREELIRQEADLYYLQEAPEIGYKYHFTIKNNTLIPASGIDESNGNGYYVLWPADPQLTANTICRYLREEYGIEEVGVLITDSTIFPSRWGTLGMAIGYSGFLPVKDYVGKEDIFGRPMTVSNANVAGGLASAAVLAMGEGAEQTPIAVLENLPFVEFRNNEPTIEELERYYVSPLKDEPFSPFFNSRDWHARNLNDL